MSQPKVSIIIPTFKRALSLERAIKSVLNQTYENIEIIVVDDNNYDSPHRAATEYLMKKYTASKRIKYIQHRLNKGGSAARNTGILESDAEYIAFLDDDDEFHFEKIQKQLLSLEGLPDKWKAAYCNVIKISNSKPHDYSCFGDEGDLTYSLLSMQNSIYAGSTLLIKRSALLELKGFNTAYSRHQDWELILRFFEKGHLLKLAPDYLTFIHTDFRLYIPDGRSCENATNKFLTDFSHLITKFNKEQQDIIYTNHYYYVGVVCFQSRQLLKGLSYLKKCKGMTMRKYFSGLVRYILSFLMI